MPKTTKQPTVTVCIVPGKAADYQKRLYRLFWSRLISKVKGELKAVESQTEGNGEQT